MFCLEGRLVKNLALVEVAVPLQIVNLEVPVGMLGPELAVCMINIFQSIDLIREA